MRLNRLTPDEYTAAFADAAPLLTAGQAQIESERCLYCFDAPCTTACPSEIDVPRFIHRIADGNLVGAARTILEANPLGGTCARACPTEVLCEQVCVKVTQEDRPIAIGRLQRYAVDRCLERFDQPLFQRAEPTPHRVAIVGAGPAGLTCAHMLARLGHAATIFDARPKAGGLNEYGLATYKMTEDYAQREINWLLEIGGIEIVSDWTLHDAGQLESLRARYDAVFLGLGLPDVWQLEIPGEDLAGVRDAVDFIAELRQAKDPGEVPMGRKVLVIGGGMTAIDAAVQARLLGADSVRMVYRRGAETMPASEAERQWAQIHGVGFDYWLAPGAVIGVEGSVAGVRFVRQAIVEGKLAPTGEDKILDADMVLKAIGQRLDSSRLAALGLELQGNRIRVDGEYRTNLPRVWAGGDCRFGGRDLTVEAVRDGKRAAQSIHGYLSQLKTGRAAALTTAG
ncbi:MAG: NAD(P)-dependent oxidoreductase [Burkholderiaceae bacterium]|jgi:glutamate synthase (NADPH/NADH) small chain